MSNAPSPNPKSKIEDPKWHDRIARKCAAVLSRAIDSLPNLLKESEPEAAAAIVADLIKSYMGRPLPEPDPYAPLAEVIRIARQADDEQPDS
jgi:hypothetical protein